MAHFTKEQAQAARQADLSAFLMRTDPGHYVREGQSIRLIDPSLPKRDRRKSISIKMGTNWWHDFATGETGNCVEYLTKKMGYNLVDAIMRMGSARKRHRLCYMGMESWLIRKKSKQKRIGVLLLSGFPNIQMKDN